MIRLTAKERAYLRTLIRHAVKDAIRARGAKVSSFSAKAITRMVNKVMKAELPSIS